jgi:hypothetical protein
MLLCRHVREQQPLDRAQRVAPLRQGGGFVRGDLHRDDLPDELACGADMMGDMDGFEMMARDQPPQSIA